MAKPTNPLLRRAVYVFSRLRTRRAFTFRGASFQVTDGVFNPTTFRASLLFARLALVRAPSRPSRVLELGCGCGLTSVLLARAGHQLTAIDIDPLAVENSLANANRNGVSIRALVSDWGSALAENDRFDFIAANPPFLVEEPPAFHRALYAGPGAEVLGKALTAARARLAENGRVLVLTSDRTGRAAFLAAARDADLRIFQTHQHRQWLDTYIEDVLTPA